MNEAQERRLAIITKIQEMGINDFQKSTHAYDCWIVHSLHFEQRVVTRGIPGKLPYSVGNSPAHGLGLDPIEQRYWQHYGYEAQAPIIFAEELSAN